MITDTQLQRYACIYTHMYKSIRVYKHRHVHMYAYAYTNPYAHIYIYINMNIHMYTHVETEMRRPYIIYDSRNTAAQQNKIQLPQLMRDMLLRSRCTAKPHQVGHQLLVVALCQLEWHGIHVLQATKVEKSDSDLRGSKHLVSQAVGAQTAEWPQSSISRQGQLNEPCKLFPDGRS